VPIKDLERQPAARLVISQGVAKPADESTVGTLRQRLAEAQRKLEDALNPGSTPAAGRTIPAGDGHRLNQGENPLETIQDQVLGALIPKADVSDKQIAEDISTNLQAKKEAGLLKGFGLRMRVNQGIVWFTGQVATAENRQAIGDIARKTQGVKEVVNELKLTAADESVDLAIGGTTPQLLPTMSDNDIAMMISGELKAKKKAGKLTNFSLQMTVKEGKVWLRGYVPSRKQRDMALAAAEAVVGVGAVVNEINIELPIARNIASLLPQALRPQSMQSGIPSLAQLPVAMAGAMVAAPAHLVGAVQGGRQVAPAQMASSPSGIARARYDQPQMPNYAWPTYAAHPNYGAVTYPKQYSPSAWPYIGPFYPYPQVPLGWRRVTLEWDDGWWFLDFSSRR
jgi:osmotically-inducible protein OsmY